MSQLGTVRYTARFLRLPVRLQLWICALGVAMYTTTPVLAQTRDVPLGRHAALPLSQEPTMTHLAPAPPAAAKDTAVRPFRVNVPEADLLDLRRRIAAIGVRS